MTQKEYEELLLLRKVEDEINRGRMNLLMTEQPNDCGCAGAPKFVFRCPEAFTISNLIDSIRKLRGY